MTIYKDNEKRENIRGKTATKRDYIWNTAAGLLNASEAVLLSMLVTRVTGLEDAGILTIAFATANLLGAIGKYGVRNYQITDQGNYSFHVYFRLRVVTVVSMILISIVFVLYGVFMRGDSVYKMGTVLIMCLIFAVEAFEDVYWGLYQKNGRLDIGAKMFVFRWSGIMLTYLVLLPFTRNLLHTTAAALLVSLILFLVCKYQTYPRFRQEPEKEYKESIVSLGRECLPLCLMGFMTFYMSNAPKYSIDAYMTERDTACWGFVSMPVFVVGLLSSFLYQPIIVSIATAWREGRYEQIVRKIKMQTGIILLLTCLCVLGAYLLGVPVLSLLYHTDLAAYRTELLLLVGGGGVLAGVSFFVVILTVMRLQRYIITGYGAGAVLSFCMFPVIVRRWGTFGAAVCYGGIMLLLAVMFGTIVIKRINMHAHKTG